VLLEARVEAAGAAELHTGNSTNQRLDCVFAAVPAAESAVPSAVRNCNPANLA
jgi:hypothetical protein